MSGPAPALLELENVDVVYDGCAEPAVRGISFRIGPGEKVALLGGNGSGKTSVLLAAAGLVHATGRIVVCGTRLTRRTEGEIRRKIGFLFSVPDDQILLQRVEDDVGLSLRQRNPGNGSSADAVLAALRRLDIQDLAGAFPPHLSHGQRLRVALAGAIAGDPELLLLDEPTGGLDPAGRRRLATTLRSFGSAALIATHDLVFARACCSRYILLHGGCIAGEGLTDRDLEPLLDPEARGDATV